MAKVTVRYRAVVTQIIDWPDDEMSDFNYENLECNVDPDRAAFVDCQDVDIIDVKVDGKEFIF